MVHAQYPARFAATGVSARILAAAGTAQRRRVRLAAGGADRVGGLSPLALPALRLAARRARVTARAAGDCTHGAAESRISAHGAAPHVDHRVRAAGGGD